MAFKRWGCDFEGPWPGTCILKKRKGIWVVWRRLDSLWDVIAVGESENVHDSFAKNEVKIPEIPPGKGTIYLSATYTPRLSDSARRKLAGRIRKVSDHG